MSQQFATIRGVLGDLFSDFSEPDKETNKEYVVFLSESLQILCTGPNQFQFPVFLDSDVSFLFQMAMPTAS